MSEAEDVECGSCGQQDIAHRHAGDHGVAHQLRRMGWMKPRVGNHRKVWYCPRCSSVWRTAQQKWSIPCTAPAQIQELRVLLFGEGAGPRGEYVIDVNYNPERQLHDVVKGRPVWREPIGWGGFHYRIGNDR